MSANHDSALKQRLGLPCSGTAFLFLREMRRVGVDRDAARHERRKLECSVNGCLVIDAVFSVVSRSAAWAFGC